MNRTGLAIAGGIGLITGLVFAIFPQLDLEIARLFYVADAPPEARFALAVNPAAQWLRDASMAAIALLVIPVAAALALKLARPHRRMLVPGRVPLFFFSTLIIGPLLVTNLGLKDHWSRPRPRDVVQFGGSEPFVPWWDPRGTCHDNCSFVAGEAAGAAWTFGPAALAPAPWRGLAYAGAIAFSAAVGILRMAFGGHFFSDVAFACVLIFMIVWITHGVLYRWRTRISDAAAEAAVGRAGMALRRLFRFRRA